MITGHHAEKFSAAAAAARAAATEPEGGAPAAHNAQERDAALEVPGGRFDGLPSTYFTLLVKEHLRTIFAKWDRFIRKKGIAAVFSRCVKINIKGMFHFVSKKV